jgi:hypothetical protein
MKYIGTSLGQCLTSLMANEVSEDDVMFIVTRTMCPDHDSLMEVVEQYYADGTPITRTTYSFVLSEYKLEDVKSLASRLYFSGKIHQPRVFAHGSSERYVHPTQFSNDLWMEVVPTNRNTTPAVVEAYDKYRMLDALTK